MVPASSCLNLNFKDIRESLNKDLRECPARDCRKDAFQRF